MSIDKDQKGVFLLFEFDVSELFESNRHSFECVADFSKYWHFDEHTKADEMIFNIDGDTKQFLKQITALGNAGAPQGFISYLKYARDKGAKYVLFFNKGK